MPKSTLFLVLLLVASSYAGVYEDCQVFIDIYPATGRIDKSVVAGFLSPDGLIAGAGDPEYNSNRTIWNMLNHRLPKLICIPGQDIESDIACCLGLASYNGYSVGIAGAGHSYYGLSVEDRGMLIRMANKHFVGPDYDFFTGVLNVPTGKTYFDPARGTIILPPSTNIYSTQFYLSTFGRYLVSAGVCAHVGLGGHCTGGGFNHMAVIHGPCIDNIVSYKAILPNGTSVVARKDNQYSDLYFALAGAGHNFMPIIEMEVKVHQYDQLWYRMLTYGFDAGEGGYDVIQTFMRKLLALERPTNSSIVITALKSLPGLVIPDRSIVLQVEISFAGTYEGMKAVENYYSFADTIGNLLQVSANKTSGAATIMDYYNDYYNPANWNSLGDGNYVYESDIVEKSTLRRLFDPLLELEDSFFDDYDSYLGVIIEGYQCVGGSTEQPVSNATTRGFNSFDHRKDYNQKTRKMERMCLVANIGTWTRDSATDRYTNWLKAVERRNRDSSYNGHAYQNYETNCPGNDNCDYMKAYYPYSGSHVRQIKTKYDPTNVFSYSQSVKAL